MLPEKPNSETHLTLLREQAGLTLRELARQVGTSHSNLLYWERSGKVGKMEFLLPIAKALGVTVEEILGQPRPRKTITAGGKMGQLFEEASKMPRSQQDKVVAVLEPFVTVHRMSEATSS
jgi:transcriptional regulator with XRE-family HTH domain